MNNGHIENPRGLIYQKLALTNMTLPISNILTTAAHSILQALATKIAQSSNFCLHTFGPA